MSSLAAPVAAQEVEPPADPPIVLGPVVLAPVIRLDSVGYDSNVLNLNEDQNPRGDTTGTFSPSVDAWLRSARFRVAASTRVDFYYFRELTDLRAVDREFNVHVDAPLNRLAPFVRYGHTTTRHRRNLEIDSLAERRVNELTAGTSVRVSPRATAEIFLRRSNLDYETGAVFLDTDLSQVLNHTSTGLGLGFNYAITTLTSVGLEVERERARFDFATERDSNSLFVRPYVEFKPLALVSGRASIGFQRRTLLAGEDQQFNGTVMAADLTYTLLGRTRFNLSADRSLQYSYITGLSDYLQTGLTLSIVHQITEAWDVGGSISRSRLSYSSAIGPQLPLLLTDEVALSQRVDAGRRFSRLRLGFLFEHNSRDPDGAETFRGFDRFRYGATATYQF